MSFETPSKKSPPFLRLPIEIRNNVYKELLSIQNAKTPKPFPDTCASAVRYNWNLHPNILSTSRQIYQEASHVMGSENSFVTVECATKELEQIKSDTQIMRYNVRLWPGKQCKIVKVPNERMRIRFDREGSESNAKRKDPKPWFCVLVEEELRDVIVGISCLQYKDGSYRTSGLSAVVSLSHATQDETDSQRSARETKLLTSLCNLRFLKSIEVQGALEGNRNYLSAHFCCQQWDHDIVYSTIAYLIDAGDQASKSGYHVVATGHYQRAHDYARHFISKEKQTIAHFADPSAFLFKIHLHRARNWIEQGNHEVAFGASDIALTIANDLFRTKNPAVGDPPVDRNGCISTGKLRKWTCEGIKDGAAIFGQRIKCEDIGRAYYYRSIAGHVFHGDKATDQAYEDRALGIGCCVISETNQENLPNELLELDVRTMRSLKSDDSDEWEDCEE